MKRKIDLLLPLRNAIPWRLMLGAGLMFCMLSSVSSFGQSAALIQQLDQQGAINMMAKQMLEQQNILNQIDQSTPEGQAEYLALLEKYNQEWIAAFQNMSPSEQSLFLSLVSENVQSGSNPIMNGTTPSSQKFLMNFNSQDNVITQTSPGNYVISSPVTLPQAPKGIESIYNDTFPMDPVK